MQHLWATCVCAQFSPCKQNIYNIKIFKIKNLFIFFQTEPSVFHFVLIASCLVTGHHRREPGSVLFSPSLQVFIYMDICQEPPEPLLQAGKPQLSQSLLKFQVLHLLHHPYGSSLDPPVYVGFSCNGEPRT